MAKMTRRAVLGTAAAGLAASVPGVAAAAPLRAAGTTRRITMYAEKISDELYGYGLAPGGATVPGPVLEMWEGDTLEIDLVNTTDRVLSLHPHGVDYDVNSDGTLMNGSAVMPGQTRRYTWRSHVGYRRADGSWAEGTAGYWHYHDHAMGTEHGTEGVLKGLYGALVVRRQGDLLPKRQFTVVFNDMTINNRAHHDAPTFEANLGERVEWIAIGHGSNFHTFHLHGHRWLDNRTGMRTSEYDPSPLIDIKDLNPGVSFGFQVIAGEGVGPGMWMYHCHVQNHSDMGMAGMFLVRNADGTMPVGVHEH
ncbi:multicopper oxidase domain-containing protein [Amycolatopsis thermoflava]|uniref:multicopper oxidase domain-containing protein n=1 Tax=Amycolatopsis thermoflava TaxID=84480 RepID=UPI00364E8898